MIHDLLGVVAEQRQRQLVEEAQHQRLVTSIRRAQGRHGGPRRAVSEAWLRLRRSVSAAGTAAREIAAMPDTDQAVPRLHDYPIARRPAPRPCNADG